jgi:hypothetical protein
MKPTPLSGPPTKPGRYWARRTDYPGERGPLGPWDIVLVEEFLWGLRGRIEGIAIPLDKYPDDFEWYGPLDPPDVEADR